MSSRAGSIAVSRALCCLWLISLASGCLDAETVVFVRKDGSGTVTEKVMVANEVAAWSGSNSPAAMLAVQKGRCAARASAMGREAKLESFQEVREKGMTGYMAVYAFKDVRNLILDPQPDVSLLGHLAPKQAAKAKPVTFGFDRGGTASLVVNFPKPRPDEASQPLVPPPPLPRNLAAEQRAVIRTMFADFRVRLNIKLQGTIAGTTATYVEPGVRDTVVLMDMNIGKLLKTDRYIDRLLTMGRIDDVDTARKRLATMPDIRLESSERIEIGFK